MYFGMNAVLRAASKPKKAMCATIFTVVMNILLDVVFIRWWHWGIKGAALATIISQTLALCWQMTLFANKNELLHLKRGIYKLKANLVKNIISIGISPFLMNACACVIVIFINNQLVRFGGDMSVGAYSIGNSIAMIFVMSVIGLNQGMQPIAGYNYGAQQYERMMRVVKLSIITATCIMLTGWSLAMFVPYHCVRLFTTNPELIKRSINALHIIMMMFPLIGCQMVITNFFQCIGKVKISIFLSLSRQLLFLLPLLILLPNFYGINGVWASMPTSDFIAVVVAIITMTVYLRRFKKDMQSKNS
jgi:MATE efflux family protein